MIEILKTEFTRFTDITRDFVSEELLIYSWMLFFTPLAITMSASFFSIFRIHYALKRDGIKPPGLGVLRLYSYEEIIARSPDVNRQHMKLEKENEQKSIVRTSLIYTYIKPFDRFVTRASNRLFVPTLVISALYYWLYSS